MDELVREQIRDLIMNTFMPCWKIAEVLDVPMALVQDVAEEMQAEDE